jgi:uncharacterized protein YneF (UPF0154 family)
MDKQLIKKISDEVFTTQSSIKQYIKNHPESTEYEVRQHYINEILPYHFTKKDKEIIIHLFSLTEYIDMLEPDIDFDQLIDPIWKQKYKNITIQQFKKLSLNKNIYKTLLNNPNLNYQDLKKLQSKKVHWDQQNGQIKKHFRIFQKDPYPITFLTKQQRYNNRIRQYLYHNLRETSLEQIEDKNLIQYWKNLKKMYPFADNKQLLETIEIYRLMYDN